MKLLLFSPDQPTIGALLPFLERAGHVVETADHADDAAAFLAGGMVEGAILDCAPRGRVPVTISDLRSRPPILAITDPHGGSKAVVDLLDSGADDAMLIPLDMAELLARLRALHRRASGIQTPIVTVGRLSFDPALQVARADGQIIPLTGKEVRLFAALIMGPGRTFSKELLLSVMYNDRDEPELKIIDVFICKLRKKIAAITGGDGCIETIWGRGYTIRSGSADAREAA